MTKLSLELDSYDNPCKESEIVIMAQTIGEEVFLESIFKISKKYQALSNSELEFLRKLAD